MSENLKECKFQLEVEMNEINNINNFLMKKFYFNRIIMQKNSINNSLH